MIGLGMFFFVLVIAVGTIAWIGNWMLRPLEQAAAERRAAVRVSIADLFCLFVNVQLPLGLLAWFMVATEVDLPAGILIFYAVLGLVVWYNSVARLSRAGISSGRDRLVFLGVVVPVAFYGIPAFVVLTPIALLGVLFGQFDLTHVLALTACMATGMGLVACGKFTHRMVHRFAAETTRIEADADHHAPFQL